MYRLIDIIVGIVLLAVSLPVWPLIALGVKLSSRGPVFFRQLRWGREGTQFQLLKFRTMYVDADATEILAVTENDPRVTKIGRLLRATGLDELPQILNILRGDMSFVGPRALAVNETLVLPGGRRVTYEELEGFRERLTVRPGLTGTATIYLPRDASPIEKFEYDLAFIRDRSVGLVVKLIGLSFFISFSGRWERRQEKLPKRRD